MTGSVDNIERIGPAARSPRAGEQFPYRPRVGHEAVDIPAIREELNEFFKSNMPLVRRVIARAADFLPQHARNDLLSDTLIYLISRAIPKYEPARGAKLTSFVWACTRNHLTLLLRNLLTKKTVSIIELTESLGIAAADTSCDRRVEELADNIISQPERYLTPGQTAFFNDCMEFPGSSVWEQAKRLGNTQASSASMLRSRTRERIATFAKEMS